MTGSGKSPRLSVRLAEPFVEIPPDDAAALYLKATELMEISASRGQGLFHTLIKPRAPQEQLLAPMHWSHQKAARMG